MAVPTIRATNELTGTPTNTSHTIPLPAGFLAGDLLIAALQWRLTGATISTPPTGWTSLDNEPGTNINEAVFYKIAAGGDANPVFVMSVTVPACGQSIAITTGTFDTASPINAHSILENASSVSCTASSITTTVNDCLLLFFGAAVGATTFIPDALMSELQESASNEAGNNCGGELASESWVTAGITGTRTSTLSTAQRNIAALLAIAPAGAVVVTVAATGTGAAQALLVGAGASETLYYLIVNDANGNRLAIVQDYLSIECARVVNGVGVLSFSVPSNKYALDTFKVDGLVELWRASKGGSARLEFEQLWFIRERYKLISQGVRLWRIVAYDLNYMLGNPSANAGRIVAYSTDFSASVASITDAYTEKTGAADDMLKQVARENMASAVVDATRNLTSYFFSVQSNTTLGAVVKVEMARRNLLKEFQELCAMSATAGVYLAWDILCAIPPNSGATLSLILNTYTAQRGLDHRVSSNQPLLVGPDYGNLEEVELGFINTDEANFIYAGGKGEEAVRPFTTASDVGRINVSPYNRREQFLDASNVDGPVALQDAADSALRAGRPLITLSGRFVDTDQARYAVHWNFGDYITAQVDGYSFDCRLDAVALSFARDTGEMISVKVRSESVGP